MTEKDKTDKKFEEMYNYLMDQAGGEASYGGAYEVPYDAEGGHTKEEAEAEYAKLFRELHGIPEEDIFAAKKNRIFVVGHINPDTDSIVSSMAYANLKNQIDNKALYVPMRAGKVNEETQFVLDEVGVEPPELLTNAGTQIMDIDIRELQGISEDITLKSAWKLLKEKEIVTLPITEKIDGDNNEQKEKLKGLITVKDIGHIYMDAGDTNTISKAETPYENIKAAIDGNLMVDNDQHIFSNGKVVVAAADYDLISDYVEKGDIVIVSNRDESHKAAIDANAGCIVVTLGTKVSDDIKELAKEKNCAIITTEHDTYTTARLMNQSIPVKFAMLNDNMITFCTTDYLDDVKKIMLKVKHRDFPVLDEDGYYVGMISRRYLVDAKKKKMILVDHNEKTQAVDGIEDANILEIIDHHRLSSVETIQPVFFRNEPVGSTSAIITEMYKEYEIELDKNYAQLLCAGILSDTLMFKSPTTSQKDKIAAIELANMAGIDMVEFASSMFRAGSIAGDKDPKELLMQDYKTFTIDGTQIGIGQFNSMESDELGIIKDKIIEHMEKERQNMKLDMLFYMLTNIVEGQTEILFAGGDSKDTLEDAFEVKIEDDSLIIAGLISRKKQMVPEIIAAMQQ